MKRWVCGAVMALVLVGGHAANAKTERDEDRKALCPVCRVMQGELEAEEVKAVRTYEGVEYGFCSKECAKEFDADPTAFLPPVFPRPAPAFNLKDLDGTPVTSTELAGKVTLVDFWATWCVPCRKSMPELQVLQDEFADMDFAVVGISIDEAKHRGRVEDFVEDHEIDYTIAMDSEKSPAWHTYRVKAIPAAFLIDREGQIVAQWTGRTADPDEVREKLEQLLAVHEVE